jgi:hypothetical protein
MRALVAAAAFGLGACMGPNFVGPNFVDEGGRRVAASAAHCSRATRSSGRSPYAPDGAKLIERGEHRRRALREDGIMCEQLTVSTAESADQGILYTTGFRPDGTTAPLGFRIEPGDARSSLASR